MVKTLIWGAWIEEHRSDLRNEFKSNIVGRLSDEIRVSGGLKFRPWFAEKASLDTSMYFYEHIFLHSAQDIADNVNPRASLRVSSVPEEDDEDDDEQEGDDDGHHA